MPWQLDGTFQRTNPDFNDGNDIWQQDQQAGNKVIASRHDYHDEDLAQGIEQSLNINGLNAMASDLDMGGYEITNRGDLYAGDFIPTLEGGTGLTVTGKMFWTRTNDLVLVFGRVSWTGTPDTPTNTVSIGGLPFTVSNVAEENGAGAVGRVEGIDFGAVASAENLTAMGLEGIGNSDEIGLYLNYSLGSTGVNAGTSPQMAYIEFDAAGYFDIQFMYNTEDPI